MKEGKKYTIYIQTADVSEYKIDEKLLDAAQSAYKHCE